MPSSSIIPCLRYRDAPAAIEWLCDVFGFEKHVVYSNDDGTVAHAELTYGPGMVMVASVLAEETDFGKQIKHPDEIGGLQTQCPYVVVSDIDSLYEKVKAVGGEIIIDIKDQQYGSRDFSCRDLEGHLWNFGTYDPWATR